MFEIVKSGGILMIPIILCSVVALAIVCERFWMLRRKRIIPGQLVAQIWHWHKNGQLGPDQIHKIREGSPLGHVLAAGLINQRHDRNVMKESIEESGRYIVHDLERYLTTLGTIAVISPLLGLLGTVLGMVEVFSVIASEGIGKPGALASGISVALITTVAGLMVAIPSLIFYRYFRGRVDELVVHMEQEAIKLVEVMHGERERETGMTGMP